ncbi:MAG: hypothetical protein ACR2Q4_24960 [Geminicoccaceae bacterium]
MPHTIQAKACLNAGRIDRLVVDRKMNGGITPGLSDREPHLVDLSSLILVKKLTMVFRIVN